MSTMTRKAQLCEQLQNITRSLRAGAEAARAAATRARGDAVTHMESGPPTQGLLWNDRIEADADAAIADWIQCHNHLQRAAIMSEHRADDVERRHREARARELLLQRHLRRTNK